MKLTPEQIERLESLGYQHSPMAQSALTEDTRIAGMIWHWQENQREILRPMLPAYHGAGRQLVIDGDAGPATIASLGLARCGHPDYRDANDERKPLEARWPDTCSPKLTWAMHRNLTLRGLDSAAVLRVHKLACDCWARNLAGVGFEQIMDYDRAQFQWRTKDLGGGGTLARHIVGTSNGCGDQIWGEWNSRLSWQEEYALTVWAHELGHGMDFDHVNDNTALMNPYITQAARGRPWHKKPNRTDLAEAKRRGYTIQYTPPGGDPDEPDDPVPTPGKIILRSKEVNGGVLITAETSGETDPGGGGFTG